MHYLIHDGKKVPPLQVMLAHSVYNRCKSKEILTQMNRFGFSVSYPQLMKFRYQSNNELVPIPSQLNREKFTIGAFDNFDHKDVSSISRVNDSHDTVMLLFQNCKNSEKVVQRYLSERSFQASDRKHNLNVKMSFLMLLRMLKSRNSLAN